MMTRRRLCIGVDRADEPIKPNLNSDQRDFMRPLNFLVVFWCDKTIHLHSMLMKHRNVSAQVVKPITTRDLGLVPPHYQGSTSYCFLTFQGWWVVFY
jgi:hypothetical protein